jgi:hypothetical protein
VKIEIKRNLIIFHEPDEWEDISAKIIKEHGHSMLLSWKMRRELGVTVRRHKGLVPWDYTDDAHDELKGRFYYKEQVHLDFWDEASQSFFVLKYLG